MQTRQEIFREVGKSKREAEYWEMQYKALNIQYTKRVEEIKKLQSQVELWRGTGL